MPQRATLCRSGRAHSAQSTNAFPSFRWRTSKFSLNGGSDQAARQLSSVTSLAFNHPRSHGETHTHPAELAPESQTPTGQLHLPKEPDPEKSSHVDITFLNSVLPLVQGCVRRVWSPACYFPAETKAT